MTDADEGNLFPTTVPTFYGLGNKVFRFAGNVFGLARDGSRPNTSVFAVDEFRFDQRTKVRFGSNLDGLNDDAEANIVYDTQGFSVNANAPDNDAWILLRGNKLVNNTILPMDETTGQNTYNKFIDTGAANPITPVIASVTATTLTGSCGLPLPGVASVVIDIYESDPEGDGTGAPQGLVYLGSLADNGPADSNPAVGAFTLNVTALGVHSGKKITITANYLKTSAPANITGVSRGGGNTTLTVSGGNPPHNIYRASLITGP